MIDQGVQYYYNKESMYYMQWSFANGDWARIGQGNWSEWNGDSNQMPFELLAFFV